MVFLWNNKQKLSRVSTLLFSFIIFILYFRKRLFMLQPFDKEIQEFLRKISIFFLISFIVLAALSILRIIKLDQIFPPCFFFTKTGLFCPSCGGTRSFLHFINGDFIGSLKYNIFVPYFFILIVLGSFDYSKIKKGFRFKFCPAHVIALPMLLLINCIIHNIIIIFT